MKIVLNHKETEDVLSASLDYAKYLEDQMREFGDEPQISEQLLWALDAVLGVRSKMFSEGEKINLSDNERNILGKILIKTAQKYYDKANEYRGTFSNVYKAFEAAGDRYTAILKKLTDKE